MKLAVLTHPLNMLSCAGTGPMLAASAQYLPGAGTLRHVYGALGTLQCMGVVDPVNMPVWASTGPMLAAPAQY